MIDEATKMLNDAHQQQERIISEAEQKMDKVMAEERVQKEKAERLAFLRDKLYQVQMMIDIVSMLIII